MQEAATRVALATRWACWYNTDSNLTWARRGTASPVFIVGSSMFRQRALSAAIALPILYGLIFLDGFPWTYELPLLLVVVVVSMCGAEELRHMLRGRGFSPPKDMGLMMGALPPLFLYFYHYQQYNNVVLLGLSLAITVDVLVLALALIGDISRRVSGRQKASSETHAPDEPRQRKEAAEPPPHGGTVGALRDFVILAAGALYVGGLLSSLLFLRRVDEAIAAPWTGWPVALIVAAVWIADTAAFAAGKLLDGPKLLPRLSPGKTIVGTLAGICAAVIVFVVAAASGLFAGPFDIGLARAAAIGVAVGVAGLGGDLAESAVKRWAGVKDSGSLIPGHGGVLDRFDSLLWAAPVFFYLLYYSTIW